MKKVAFLSVLLLAILLLSGCGKKEEIKSVDNADEAIIDNVKVKPASIELEERGDEDATTTSSVASTVNTLVVDFSEFDAGVDETRTFERKADTEINTFRGLNTSDDREVSRLSAALPEGGLVPEEVKTAEQAMSAYRASDDNESKVAFLQKAGQILIGRRIWTLTLSIAQLDGLGAYSNVVNQLENQKNNLESLRNGINSNTDPESLYDDVASVITDYWVYRVSEPKARGLAAVYRLGEFRDQVDSLVDGVQQKINEVGNNMSVDEAQTILGQATDRLANAKNSLEAAEGNLKSMSVASFEDANAMKKLARDNINDARSDSKVALKELGNVTEKLMELVDEYNQLLLSQAVGQ